LGVLLELTDRAAVGSAKDSALVAARADDQNQLAVPRQPYLVGRVAAGLDDLRAQLARRHLPDTAEVRPNAAGGEVAAVRGKRHRATGPVLSRKGADQLDRQVRRRRRGRLDHQRVLERL